MFGIRILDTKSVTYSFLCELNLITSKVMAETYHPWSLHCSKFHLQARMVKERNQEIQSVFKINLVLGKLFQGELFQEELTCHTVSI